MPQFTTTRDESPMQKLQRKGTITQKSHKFLKTTAVKDLGQAEHQWHRSRHAVSRVTHALERKADELNVPRPIRHFEAQLFVSLHHHFMKKSGLPTATG